MLEGNYGHVIWESARVPSPPSTDGRGSGYVSTCVNAQIGRIPAATQNADGAVSEKAATDGRSHCDPQRQIAVKRQDSLAVESPSRKLETCFPLA